jgi:hypothetical protein
MVGRVSVALHALAHPLLFVRQAILSIFLGPIAALRYDTSYPAPDIFDLRSLAGMLACRSVSPDTACKHAG